ncbi:hypothetical protein [Novosphingobium beihaiensis]|uniref:Uncharacterized protein n=1 Tax=Novosphingobium beihaiensis TaxID=2930389 RepID=A0ABT0BJI9_9SPHN|nr:hypothetical protein [Novosphingobium beihaiensis]MCJ2185222.1 hypothetical protein [Novosphingobium beihaiensis]
MIVEIALGILLALLLLAVGIAALVLIIKALPEILAYVGCLGSLLLLTHFLGGWGLALWFALIIGFICFADREAIFNQTSAERLALRDD